METFSQRIERLRRENSLTQEELGNKIGLKRAAVHKMEKGLTINPKRATIEKLAIVFGVSPSYIMCLTDNKEQGKISNNEFKDLVLKKLEHTIMNDADKEMIKRTLEYICGGDK